MSSQVNQKGASAGGDVVGRDKIERHYYVAPTPLGIVEQLLEKLQAEIEQNEEIRHTIEALAYFRTRRSGDGIHGLQAKLQAGERSHEYLEALEKKELFAKLLEKWSLYASARRSLLISWRRRSTNLTTSYTRRFRHLIRSRSINS